MLDELAIVIPAKNEEDMIGNLLSSLCIQNYSHMRETPIFIADADSTDSTIQVANSFSDRLDIRIVKGGTPSEGRNAGANAANSRYILFLDADIELTSKSLITRAVNMMKRQERHCITTCILSKEKSLIENLMYCANLAIQVGSKFSRPFCPGAFMLFDRERFMQLGGFNEKVLKTIFLLGMWNQSDSEYSRDLCVLRIEGFRRWGASTFYFCSCEPW